MPLEQTFEAALTLKVWKERLWAWLCRYVQVLSGTIRYLQYWRIAYQHNLSQFFSRPQVPPKSLMTANMSTTTCIEISTARDEHSMILHRLYIVKPSVIGDNKWGAGWAWQKLPTVQHFNDLAWLGKYGDQLFIYFDKGFRIMNDCLKDNITFHCTDGPICRAWCGGRYPNVGGFCWRVEMLSVLFAQGLSLPSRNRPGQDLDLEIHGVYTL